MATSGSIDLTAKGLDIIKEALELVGAIAENGTPSTDQQASVGRTLEYMIKAWQADGTNLWAIQKCTLFLEKNKNKYSLSSTGDHITTSYVKTATAAAASSGASSIDVDSITGISANDNIGIELADGTMQWTTVSGAPSGSTINLAANLSDDVAIDAAVFSYTTKANRPMKIVNAVYTTYDEQDIPVNIIPLDEYARIPNKTSDGKVVSIYYDPQLLTGNLYIWNETDSVRTRLTLWVQRTLDDLDTVGTYDVDYPQEWFLALSLNLAYLLSHKYGLTKTEKEELRLIAEETKEAAEGWDRDPYTVIVPEYMGDMG